jgi:hypothetical protein
MFLYSTYSVEKYNNYRNMGGTYKQGQGLIIRQIKQHHVSEGLMNLYYNVCKFRLEKQHQQKDNLKQPT